jgi:regulator of sigma E protease
VPQRSPDGKVILGFTPKKGTITTPDYITERKPLIAAVKYSIEKNYEFVVLTKEALGQIFSGKRSVKEGLSGPIGIAELSGRAYESGGIEGLLNLMGLLSLNLGVFNLFPIPVLDGGHIFMLLLEALLGLIGYKLSVALKEKMLQAGFVLLILLMSFVVINDISKFFVPRETTPAAPTATTPSK